MVSVSMLRKHSERYPRSDLATVIEASSTRHNPARAKIINRCSTSGAIRAAALLPTHPRLLAGRHLASTTPNIPPFTADTSDVQPAAVSRSNGTLEGRYSNHQIAALGRTGRTPDPG